MTRDHPTDDLGWVTIPTQEFEYLTSENRRLVGRLKDVTLDNHALTQQIERLRTAVTDLGALHTQDYVEVERLQALTPASDFYVSVRSGDHVVMVPLETAERVELALQPEEWADIGAHFRRAWPR